jgi:hypothetical protein
MKRVAIACWPDIRLERPVHEINEMFAVHIARAGAVPFLVPIRDRGARPHQCHMSCHAFSSNNSCAISRHASSNSSYETVRATRFSSNLARSSTDFSPGIACTPTA